MDATWTHYMDRRVPKGILCQFSREGGEPWVGTADFDPMFDVGSLYWRLTGIGRRQLEAMPPQVREQVEGPSLINLLLAQRLSSQGGYTGQQQTNCGSWLGLTGYVQ